MTIVVQEFGRRLLHQLLRDDAPGLAAELAYRFFLALFPFAIFVAALGGLVAQYAGMTNPAKLLTDELTSVMPPEAASLIGSELNRVVQQQNPGLLSFGVLGAIFFATGGMNAVIKATNRALEVEESRPFWRRYVLALALTVLTGAALVGAFVLFVSGQLLAGDAATALGLRGAPWEAVTLLRWPVTAALLLAAVTILYRLAPNVRIPVRDLVPGAITFVGGWLIATWAFSVYVANFASYGATYGALAGVAILLLWFYMTAMALLVGVEVNDVLRDMRRAQGENAKADVTAVPERERSRPMPSSADDPQRGHARVTQRH